MGSKAWIAEKAKPATQRVLIGWLMIALAIGALAQSINVSAERNLSQLETTLFGVVTLILSMLGAAMVSNAWKRDETREEYQQLARPALRRVMELTRSSGLILAAIDDRRKKLIEAGVPSTDVVDEWLDSIRRMMTLHLGQLEAGVQDWQELLPADFAGLVLQSEINDLQSELKALHSALAEVQDQQSTQATAMRNQIRDHQEEIKKLRKDMPAPPVKFDYGRGIEIGSVSPGFITSEALRVGDTSHLLSAGSPIRIVSEKDNKQDASGASVVTPKKDET